MKLNQNIPRVTNPTYGTQPFLYGYNPKFQVNMPVPPFPRCRNICNPIVIAGYPGVGKTMFFENSKTDETFESKFIVCDSDSSKYKSNWPQAYIDHICTTIDNCKNTNKLCIVFVSTHREVLQRLIDLGVRFYICYPIRYLKDVYLNRYIERESSVDFVCKMDKLWDSFHDDIDEILSRKLSMVYGIQLTTGNQTLSDTLKYLMADSFTSIASENIDIFPFLPISLKIDVSNGWDVRDFILRCIDDYLIRPTLPLNTIECLINYLQKTKGEDLLLLFNPIYQKLYEKGLI